MSIIELVERVADYWNLDKSLIRPISADSLNQTAKRPRKTGFILDKATRELHYNPALLKRDLHLWIFNLKNIRVNPNRSDPFF